MNTRLRVCSTCDVLVPGERKGPGPIVAETGERCFGCGRRLTQKNVRAVDQTAAIAIRVRYLEKVDSVIQAGDVGVSVGDIWANPRGRRYHVVEMLGDGKALVADVVTGRRDTATTALMIPTNGWTCVARTRSSWRG